ncbi:LytTR family DNA-binding domain-containing protein [Sphingomonas sp.]|uniref:LytTR family DNA-binding domain-containing protein n=1 Tax=Sphingomonas sp. TaxID=28214 RepID=UPI003CC6641A
MLTLRRMLIDLAVMVALGIALALLGPFGSFAAPVATRLLFWLLLSIGGYALYMPVIRGANVLAARLALPAAALWAAGCIAASAPMAAVVWYANRLWSPVAPPTLDEAAALYGDVLIVAAIACLVLWFVTADRRVEAEAPRHNDAAPSDLDPDGSRPGLPVSPAPEAACAPAAPRLLDRLPPHLGRDLLALEMEDHYVRAHTPHGSALILLRMRDAVAELDGVAGAQVHRSWWVARAAVTGVARDGRNVRLTLVNGLDAPVARAVAPDLKAQGWY